MLHNHLSGQIIFQFLNGKIHNCFFDIHAWNLGPLHVKKHTFLKNDLVLFSLYIFEESVFFWHVEDLSWEISFVNVKINIIVNFIIQKLKNKHTFLKKYTIWARQKQDISHPSRIAKLSSCLTILLCRRGNGNGRRIWRWHRISGRYTVSCQFKGLCKLLWTRSRCLRRANKNCSRIIH